MDSCCLQVCSRAEQVNENLPEARFYGANIKQQIKPEVDCGDH